MSEASIYLGCNTDSSEFETRIYKRSLPTQTQVRQQLGSRLSEIFFENLSSEAKAWLGLTPPLTGPDVVWVSPNTRLKRKVALTPVPEPTSLHLKARTHEAILEIGGNYVTEMLNKHKLEMEEALKNQAYRFEEELKDKAKMVGWNENINNEDQFNEHKKIVGTLMEHFEKCFDELIETTNLHMKKECQLRVEEERAEIAAHMFRHLQDEVERREYELRNDFQDVLYSELNVLAEKQIDQINKEREIAIKVLQDTIHDYQKKIKEIKAEMEMCSTIDICQAITRERIECNKKIKQVRGESKIKRGSSLDVIQNLKAENAILQNMSMKRSERLMEWRKKVKVLLEEFQKFINFALKAVPGQAEYLLSMEKLMLKQFPEDSFITAEDYIQFQKCLNEKLSFRKETEINENRSFKLSKVSNKSERQLEEVRSVSSRDCMKCNQSISSEDKSHSDLNFDFDTFKSKLMMRYTPSACKEKLKKPKKSDCLFKTKIKEKSIDKSNEFYQTLTMVGINEKEHEAPIDTFLEKRLQAVFKICKDDPEFAKIMLGCSDK